MAQNGLDIDIQFLPGVGPKRAALLKRELGAETIGQLIRIYPFRYMDRSSYMRICNIRPDMAYIQIKAKVLRVDLYGSASARETIQDNNNLKFNTIRRMSVWVGDGSGEIESVDATFIQRYIAQIPTPFTKAELMRGDVDGSGDLELTDVTAIQYYLAHLKTQFPIGQSIT